MLALPSERLGGSPAGLICPSQKQCCLTLHVGSAAGQGLLSASQNPFAPVVLQQTAWSRPAKILTFSFAPYQDRAPSLELYPHSQILAQRIELSNTWTDLSARSPTSTSCRRGFFPPGLPSVVATLPAETLALHFQAELLNLSPPASARSLFLTPFPRVTAQLKNRGPAWPWLLAVPGVQHSLLAPGTRSGELRAAQDS